MEESGTGTRFDATANAYNLTNVNSSVTQLNPALVGNGCSFAGGINSGGTGQYFTVASGAYSSLEVMSVSCWVKPSNLNQGATQTIWVLFETSTKYVRLNIATSGKVLLEAANGTTVSYTSTATLSTSAWWHIVVVYGKSGIYLYINGAFDGILLPGASNAYFPKPSDFASPTFQIGRPNAGVTSYYYFIGGMDEFGLWNRFLNLYDILALYNAGAAISYATLTGLTSDPLLTNGVGDYDKGYVAFHSRPGKFGSLNDAPLPISGQLVF